MANIFAKFKSLFRSKYDKLTEEDVTRAIVQLQQQSDDIEMGLEGFKKQINELKAKCRAEKDRSMKLLYVRKIKMQEGEKEASIRHCMYLAYNIILMQRLRLAIQENRFFANADKASLNGLLGNQRGLACFLNKALKRRISAENVLTATDELFNEVERMYEPSPQIYGESKSDEELLAMIEAEEQAEDEMKVASALNEKTDKDVSKNNKGEV